MVQSVSRRVQKWRTKKSTWTFFRPTNLIKCWKIPISGGKAVLQERLRKIRRWRRRKWRERRRHRYKHFDSERPQRWTTKIKIEGHWQQRRFTPQAECSIKQKSSKDEDEDATKNARDRAGSAHDRVALPHVLTFKDVEDSLETFNGDGTQNIER